MEGYRAAHEGTAARRLPHDVLVLRGSDSPDFLDRSVSNDVPPADEARRALLLTPEGRTQADLRLINTQAALTVLARSDEDLKENWESNIFVEDVEVTRDDRSVFTVQGPDAESALRSVLEVGEKDLPSNDEEFVTVMGGDLLVLPSQRSPVGGYDVVGPDTVYHELLDDGAEKMEAEAAKTLRVEAGVPGYRNELRDRLPLATGLRHTLSFDKCYTGQEVVARVQQRGGGPDRRLRVLEFESGVEEGASNDRLEVTSAVESPRHGPIGLGFVDSEAPNEIEVAGIKAKVREDPFKP